jgi:hypothetical protein
MTKQSTHRSLLGMSFSLFTLLAVLASACSSSGVEAAATDTAPTPVPAAATAEGATRAPVPTTPPTVSDAEVEVVITSFLEARTSDNAALVVEAIAGNLSDRWVPWLLDLLRVNVSSRVSSSISEQLEAITGIESEKRIPDMSNYGSWAQSRAIDGGAGYRVYKSALYERIDPAFGPLLTSVENQVELAGIQWGGAPLGGIPELNDPDRVKASDADWMVDDEIVLGVVVNGESVAYPLRILARHEIANDTVGGDDLAIVYCTLCRSALVFERQVGNQTLSFLTSGLLLNSNKIMYDVETGTLWHHLRGLGIGGPLIGTELQLRSVNHMRWSDWVAENPDTDVLTLPEPFFFDDPERPPISYDYTPGEAYQSYYDDEDLWFPVLDTPDDFSLKTEVVGIRRGGDAVAFNVVAFNEIGEVQELEVGGDRLTIEPTGVGVRVFDQAGERLITEQSFWFAWFANNPETRTIFFDS